MISEKGLELFSEDQAEINKIWETLETVPVKKVIKTLTKEKTDEHSYIDKPGFNSSLDSSFEQFEQAAHNPFETDENEFDDAEYDDPFAEGDDQEVEIINFNPHDSREFSLSRYDVDVKTMYKPAPPEPRKSNGYFEHISTPSTDLEDIQEEPDTDTEENSHEPAEVSKNISNRLYFQQRELSRGNEDPGSGHVICDCDDCINQTDVVDCQCENCLRQRERTPDLAYDSREVTCNCEECQTRGDEPEYYCQCDHCVIEKEKHQRISENNNPETDHCKCPDCVQNSKLVLVENEPCQCEKCVQQLQDFDLEARGHRSPPQGSSQEYSHYELEDQSDQRSYHSHSDRSFDSGTEKSYRSTRSKGSNSEHSLKIGSVQLNHVSDGEYINTKTQKEYLQGKHAHLIQRRCDPTTEDNHSEVHVADGILEVGNKNCLCENCVETLPEKHTVALQPIEPNISRLLEQQLQKTEQELKSKTGEYETELTELKKENEKQHKLIQHSLSLTADAKIEATMQHEITRLTAENLDLRELVDQQTEQIRKLKKMLKVYAKRLKEGEAAEIQAELEREETKSVENVAQIKHRERNYMGMLEYKREDEGAVIKCLITDLKPKVAAGLLPGLPAYLLFMCVRQTDYVNDDEKVRSFLTSTINGIKKVVKKHHDDLDRTTMWLANTCRFLHTLKQYSGEKQFQQENTPRQNEHCLRNFDLSEYRQVFSDLAVWIYQTLIKLMEATIQPSIVAAVLDHEAIAGLTGSKPSGLRGRSSSRADDTPEHSLDSLMKSMNLFVRVLTQHAVDPELIKQIFRQVYYFLGASALNNLLLRKEMCNWSKGMQIRYNLSHLEQWLRDNKLQESGAGSSLEPIVQASQLLQARKTDADVDSVCDMCSKLTVPQIVKILNLYTPVDEFEERVPISFIRKIQQKLKERENKDNSLLMDLKFSYSVTFPFNPSKIALETIEIPEALHIGKLLTRS